HDGGYAEEVIDTEERVVKLPDGLSLREAMIYGTAGFTAALALHRMLQNDQTPEMGPIVVTGATGGVGQFAVEFFARQGFEVWAVTGKTNATDRLQALGASKVVSVDKIQKSARPLDNAV